MLTKILLVCRGNICRSPMAEALFSQYLNRLTLPVFVDSAGLSAVEGQGVDETVLDLMQEKGLDLSAHRARSLSQELLFSTDLILTMSGRQRIQIEAKFPVIRGRIHSLGKWQNRDIPDPYRRARTDFEQALAFIEQGVESWYKRLWT